MLLACERDNTAAAARDLCGCLQPLADVYAEIKAAPAQSEDDLHNMETLLEKLETAADAGDACAEKAAERYGEAFLESEEAAIREKMNAQCPEVMEMLNTSENIFE